MDGLFFYSTFCFFRLRWEPACMRREKPSWDTTTFRARRLCPSHPVKSSLDRFTPRAPTTAKAAKRLATRETTPMKKATRTTHPPARTLEQSRWGLTKVADSMRRCWEASTILISPISPASAAPDILWPWSDLQNRRVYLIFFLIGAPGCYFRRQGVRKSAAARTCAFASDLPQALYECSSLKHFISVCQQLSTCLCVRPCLS